MYTEIKNLVNHYLGSKTVRSVFEYADKPALKKLLEHREFVTISQAFIHTADNADEITQLVDAFDTYLQIHNIVGDYEESAKLLYNIIVNDETDYESENYRIIHDNYIDGILADEISCDSYILGCFSAEAIADATGWPYDLIRAAQKGEAFSEIGDAMTTEQIQKLAEIYAAADGYGHHFAQYDGKEYEIGTGEAGYYLFRTN